MSISLLINLRRDIMDKYDYFVNDVLKVVNWFKIRNFSDMKDDRNVEPLSQMKVMKLLYYVQGVSLAVYGKRCFQII